eukprot:c4040_g1_i1.p1 GENE.c4040_g1_i1~~c4040_g1_i1.p1  ORF type:complete len:225 (+),score=34.43 c4040_g1_i1:38-676(+)
MSAGPQRPREMPPPASSGCKGRDFDNTTAIMDGDEESYRRSQQPDTSAQHSVAGPEYKPPQSPKPNLWGNTLWGQCKSFQDFTKLRVCPSCQHYGQNLSSFFPNYAVLLFLVLFVAISVHDLRQAVIFAAAFILLNGVSSIILTSTTNKTIHILCSLCWAVLFVLYSVFLIPQWAWITFVVVFCAVCLHALFVHPVKQPLADKDETVVPPMP